VYACGEKKAGGNVWPGRGRAARELGFTKRVSVFKPTAARLRKKGGWAERRPPQGGNRASTGKVRQHWLRDGTTAEKKVQGGHKGLRGTLFDGWGPTFGTEEIRPAAQKATARGWGGGGVRGGAGTRVGGTIPRSTPKGSDSILAANQKALLNIIGGRGLTEDFLRKYSCKGGTLLSTASDCRLKMKRGGGG